MTDWLAPSKQRILNDLYDLHYVVVGRIDRPLTAVLAASRREIHCVTVDGETVGVQVEVTYTMKLPADQARIIADDCVAEVGYNPPVPFLVVYEKKHEAPETYPLVVSIMGKVMADFPGKRQTEVMWPCCSVDCVELR